MLRNRAFAARLPFAATLLVAVAALPLACDSGDDTVRAYPSSAGASGASQSEGGRGGAAGAAGKGGAGAAGTTAAGAAGAGTPGTGGGGAAGTPGAGTGGNTTGTAGSGQAGGAGAGANGSAGLGGASGAAASGAGGGAGAGGGVPADPYVAACASLESALQACTGVPDEDAVAAGAACRESAACAQAFYGDKAPTVLACSQLACRVPTYIDQPMYECVDTTVYTAEAKIAFLTFKDKMDKASDVCKANGESTFSKGILLAATAGVPYASRPEVFAALTSCVDQPCAQIASCVTSRVATTCSGPTFFWATSYQAAVLN